MIPASLSAINRPPDYPLRQRPLRGGRAHHHPGPAIGTVTALFTPPATSAPLGGAPCPARQTWTLADFITQALGQYNVVHRPRAPGPRGRVFTLQGAPHPGRTSPGAWWNRPRTGPVAFGPTNGSFDALELLRAASLASSRHDPSRLVHGVPPGPLRLVRPAELPVAHPLHQGPGALLRRLQPRHPGGPGPHLPEGQPDRRIRTVHRATSATSPGRAGGAAVRRGGGLHRALPGRERRRRRPRAAGGGRARCPTSPWPSTSGRPTGCRWTRSG